MFKKIISQDPFSVATLDEAKTQCRLTSSFTMDDARLEMLIGVASDLAQTYTKKMLSLGQVVVTLEHYREGLYLYGGEVETIDSITATYNGESVDVTDYTFNHVSQKLTLGSSCQNYSNFFITYNAGYATVPLKVKQGVLMLVATLYNNNEDYLVGLTAENLPYTSLELLNSVREYHAS